MSSGPNDEVQQRGRLQRLHTTRSRDAGPVCCNDWLADAIGKGRLTSSTGPQPEEPAKDYSQADANTGKNRQEQEGIVLDPATPTLPTLER